MRRETESLLQQEGHKVFSVEGDLSSESHCRQLIRDTVKELDGLDILINNAAFQMEHESIAELTAEEWDYTFRTNMYAMFFLRQSAWEHLEKGSSIINTTSVQAVPAEPKIVGIRKYEGSDRDVYQVAFGSG